MGTGIAVGMLIGAALAGLGWGGFKLASAEALKQSNHSGYVGCELVAWAFSWLTISLTVLSVAFGIGANL